jgi:ATP-dependent RNA helicase DeaD
MSQHSREKSLDGLKKQSTDILVATDVAARGLDIKNVSHIYNYDVPKTSKEYLHRIGRTARAGESGDAVTLLTHRDHDNFRRVNRDMDLDIEHEEMPYFRRIPFDRDTGYGGRNRFDRSHSQRSGNRHSSRHGSWR